MKPPPAGHNAARAKRGRWRHLRRWPRGQALTIKIEYRGGAESWWLVTARGSHGVFPGHASLEDVMHQVFSEPDYAADDQGAEVGPAAGRARLCGGAGDGSGWPQ
jgi:hypothetical protein